MCNFQKQKQLSLLHVRLPLDFDNALTGVPRDDLDYVGFLSCLGLVQDPVFRDPVFRVFRFLVFNAPVFNAVSKYRFGKRLIKLWTCAGVPRSPCSQRHVRPQLIAHEIR
jgi:hypothetical protein